MQKKITLCLIVCLFGFSGFTQIMKGTTVAHVNVGNLRYLHLENSSTMKNNNISFNPGFGYFIRNNWEIGAGLNYNSIRYMDTTFGGHTLNSHTRGINIYTDYYLGKGNLKPYFSFQTGWEQSKGSYGAGVLNSINQNHFYMAIGGGINWNINSRFSLFTEATYRKNSPFNYQGYSRLNLTMGVRFFFNRKKNR
ncbi:MAG: hypothetical protein ACRDEB_04400 [Chitinophagaceae bacterium]